MKSVREVRCRRCGDPSGGDVFCARCSTGTPGSANGVPGFAGGVASLARGAAFLLGRPRLWPLAVAPAALTVLLFGLAFWGALAWSSGLADSLTAGSWGVLDLLKGAVAFLVPATALVLAIGIAFFTFTAVATAVAGPFLDGLSARVESSRLPAGPGVEGAFVRDTFRSLADTVRLVVLQLAVLAISLPLNLVPVIGTVAWIALGAWLTAFDFLDYPLARHRYPWRARWAFLRRHAGAALGFGLGTFGLLLVPFLNLLVLPVAAVGATLLYLDLRPK